MLKFKIKLLREDAILPSQSHAGDAGWDVATPDDITIQPGETKIVPLGFSAEFESGYECQVRSRSGNAAKLSVSVLNGPGTIDCFSEDMKIKTISGDKKIDDLTINEINLSFNEKNLEVEKDQIIGIMNKGEIEMYCFETEEGNLEVTGNTPVYTLDGLKLASEILESDELISF